MLSMQELSLGYHKETILRDINLTIKDGEFVGIIGPSGAGKSTLLMSIVGGVKIFGGKFQVLDFTLNRIKKKNIIKLRHKIGLIYQGYYLVDRMSVLDNIASGMLKGIPLYRAIFKYYTKAELQKIQELMELVNIEKHYNKRCDELSGGQRQRVAIARALAGNPEIILADEPIAALDQKSAKQVMKTLKKVNKELGVSVIINLHHIEVAQKYCSHIVGINSGQIVFDDEVSHLTDDAIEKIYAN